MIDSSIPSRLREERDRLDLTQTEAAALCGVARETWSRYEAGSMSPGLEVLAALAGRGADIGYVLTGERAGAYAAAPAAQPLTAKEKSLLDNYRAASEMGRKALDATGQALRGLGGSTRDGNVTTGGVVVHGSVGLASSGDMTNNFAPAHKSRSPKR